MGDAQAQQKLSELVLDPNADPDYQVENGVLKFKGKLYVGIANGVRTHLIKALHDSAIGGQRGRGVVLKGCNPCFIGQG